MVASYLGLLKALRTMINPVKISFPKCPYYDSEISLTLKAIKAFEELSELSQF